jgi:ABC-type transport system involved in multi-copper enzyme maturation permease subunit
VKTWALVVDTWREALASFTLLGFLVVSILFQLVLVFALNLDIVDGGLAAVSLFGKAMPMHGRTPGIQEVVETGQATFAGMLYAMGVFLAVFATGSQVPHLLRRGTVDLYLSRPTSRAGILLSRFLGAVTLVAANFIYLCGGVFLIISLKTGVWNPRFFVATGLILVVFLSFLGFMYLVGVLSASTPLSIMLPYAIFIISMPLAAHDRIAAAMDSRLAANVVQGLYWVLPKSSEIGRDIVSLVLGRGGVSIQPLVTTVAFGAVCLVAAVVLFNRKNV